MALMTPVGEQGQSGTGLDHMRMTAQLGYDAAYASDLFSGVQILQPQEITEVTNKGIEAHTITIWGDLAHVYNSRMAGIRGADAIIPAGITTISPAHADWEFTIAPTGGANFAFYINPASFEEVFRDDDPAGRVSDLMIVGAAEDAFFNQMRDAYLKEMREGQSFATIALQSIAVQVCLHLARNYSTLATKPPTQISPESLRISRAKAYIHDNLEQPITLEEIASAACLSQYHFVRCFKKNEGITPYQYVIKQRLERARALVCESSMAMAEIAVVCGFSSQQHMTDMFRRAFQTTPGAMRTQRRL